MVAVVCGVHCSGMHLLVCVRLYTKYCYSRMVLVFRVFIYLLFRNSIETNEANEKGSRGFISIASNVNILFVHGYINLKVKIGIKDEAEKSNLDLNVFHRC